jgi:hypothetical protein
MRDQILLAKQQEYNGLVRDATRRYGIPGRVDEDDICQQCLILVNELLDEYPDVDPMSEEFNALVKTAFYRRVISVVRTHLTKKRDYHREVLITTYREDGQSRPSLDSLNPGAIRDADFYWTRTTDHVAQVEYEDTVRAMGEGMSEETQELLQFLAHPPEYLDALLADYNDQVWDMPDGTTRRLKTKCHNIHNQEFIAFCLDWPKQKVRYHLRILRSKAETCLKE